LLVDERVCIFVDGGNLFHSAKELGIRVDFEKLKVLVLTENQKLIRPYYYGATKKTEKQSIFFDKLREFGYEVKTLPLRSHVEGEKVIEFEKGVDVMLVTDMLVLAHRNVYDTAILVAGDKDYVYAVKALKEMGKKIQIASFEHSTARELRLAADPPFISLTKLQNKLERK